MRRAMLLVSFGFFASVLVFSCYFLTGVSRVANARTYFLQHDVSLNRGVVVVERYHTAETRPPVLWGVAWNRGIAWAERNPKFVGATGFGFARISYAPRSTRTIIAVPIWPVLVIFAYLMLRDFWRRTRPGGFPAILPA